MVRWRSRGRKRRIRRGKVWEREKEEGDDQGGKKNGGGRNDGAEGRGVALSRRRWSNGQKSGEERGGDGIGRARRAVWSRVEIVTSDYRKGGRSLEALAVLVNQSDVGLLWTGRTLQFLSTNK